MEIDRARIIHDEPEERPENDVVIRGYTSIGMIKSFGSVGVTAREFFFTENQHILYVVNIDVTSGGEYSRSGAASIQYNNLTKLISAIDKLANSEINTDRFKFSEIEYSVDELKIIVFNNEIGKIMTSIDAGGASCIFQQRNMLLDFKRLVVSAKEYIDKYKLDV